MSYDFRVRGTFGSSTRIEADAHELVLLDASPVRVVLRASGTEVALKDSHVFSVRGTGFASRDEAREQGEAWQDYVMIGFASQSIGADFGVRVPIQGGLTEAAFDSMRAALAEAGHGPVQLFNEQSGVQIFATVPPAYFSHGSATGVAGRPSRSVVNAIRSAHAADVRLSDSYRLAYDLFSASYTAPPTPRRGTGPRSLRSAWRWRWSASDADGGPPSPWPSSRRGSSSTRRPTPTTAQWPGPHGGHRGTGRFRAGHPG